MWVGIGMLVSTMLIGGVAFAAGQPVSWQVPQATVQGNGGAIELPSVKAPEAGKSLQPVAVQGSDRSSTGQELRLADGGDCNTVCCTHPELPWCPKR
jgi:hypothetical protein